MNEVLSKYCPDFYYKYTRTRFKTYISNIYILSENVLIELFATK